MLLTEYLLQDFTLQEESVFHPSLSRKVQLHPLKEVMEDEWKCVPCNHIFSSKSNYGKHLRRYHPDEAKDMKITTNVKCCLCGTSCFSFSKLQVHMEKDHEDISLSFTTLTFRCFKEFKKWKRNIELQTRSSFVKHSGKRALSDGRIVTDYHCHKSGTRASKFSKEHRLEASRSRKIGFYCPAQIRLVTEIVEGEEVMTARYQSVHIGHASVAVSIERDPSPVSEALQMKRRRLLLVKERTAVVSELQEIIHTCQSESVTLKQLQTVKEAVLSLKEKLSS